MKLYHLTTGWGNRNWGLFKPGRISTGEAKPVVQAGLVNFAEVMGEWAAHVYPILKAAGYSDQQIGFMAENSFFSKYQVTAFDPKSGMADVVIRTKTALGPISAGPPQTKHGKVIIYVAVFAGFLVWYLFAKGEGYGEVRPPLDLYLVNYREYSWYAVCTAHTPGDKYHYELALWPGFYMSSMAQGIEAREGTYDRMVFLGTHFEVVGGKVFWHWYNWDFFDVEFVGMLTRRTETMFLLREGYADKFAPPKPWFSVEETRFEPLTAWWDEMTKFW